MLPSTVSVEKVHFRKSSSIKQLVVLILFMASVYFIFKQPKRRVPWEALKQAGGMCNRTDGLTDLEHRRFVIVLDAGSTGSRVHVYRFKMCGDQISSVEDELFAEVKPGLSSYPDDPKAAANSLAILLDKAKKAVPRDLHRCTPIVLKATAGLRLLKDEQADAILRQVRQKIRNTPFHVGPIDTGLEQTEQIKRAVSVMDGREEGLLAWMTVKFLQIQEATPIVLELGGGSAQIVFQVPSLPSEKELWNDFYTKEYFAGLDHIMYQNSYLGYGLMEARKQIIKAHVNSNQTTFDCIPNNFNQTVSIDPNMQTILIGSARANWTSCVEHIKRAMFPEGECKFSSGCSFNGIHQPAIPANTPVIAFSYFNDRLGNILELPKPFSIDSIEKSAFAICSGDITKSHFLYDNQYYCLDLAYIYSLLKYGFRLTNSNPISCTKKINGYEAGWALGSAVQVLGRSELGTCPRY